MVVSLIPSDPWVVFTTNDKWSWITETAPWSASHCINAFFLYSYLREFRVTILLCFFWEMFEASVAMIFDTPTTSPFTETRYDSVVGDPISGLIGILLAELLIRATQWDRTMFPIDLIYWKPMKFAKYLFQVVLLALPNIANRYSVFSSYAPLGILIAEGWIPLMLYAFYHWNRNELCYKKVEKKEKGKDLVVTWESVQCKKRAEQYYDFYLGIGIFAVLFLAGFFIRIFYGPLLVYLYALIGGGILVFIILYVNKRKVPKKSKK